MQRCCAVLVCLSMCGHGSGNGTPCAGRAICASFDPLGVYIYAVGVESCATRLPLLRSVPLTDPNRGRAWHPREFGAVLGVSASLPLPASPLPSSSRRYAPQCFVGEYTSSPCDVSHRASDEPRRRMSLSSALAPMSLASPSIRRVCLRSFCARRRPVSSLNLVRVSPGAKRSRRRRAQCGVQIRCAVFHNFFKIQHETRRKWYNAQHEEPRKARPRPRARHRRRGGRALAL